MLPTYRPNFVQVPMPGDRWSRPGSLCCYSLCGVDLVSVFSTVFDSCDRGFSCFPLFSVGDSKHIAVILPCVEMGHKNIFSFIPTLYKQWYFDECDTHPS